MTFLMFLTHPCQVKVHSKTLISAVKLFEFFWKTGHPQATGNDLQWIPTAAEDYQNSRKIC